VRKFGAVAIVVTIALSAGCVRQERLPEPARRPAEVRAQIARMIPASVADRDGWATDIYAAFSSLEIATTTQNLCAAVAVTEQESTFTANPVVPGLGKISRAEIDRRAERHHIPQLLVRAALSLTSPNGKSYAERIESARTELDLSRTYEDMISEVPLGKQLFADANPVQTAGPMQVSIAFAEQHVRDHAYPYPLNGPVRHEVFTRRGGMYFGIAHLLGYPAAYDQPLYRFADFNAGRYASRNAAFQKAITAASGIPLVADGDLIRAGSDEAGATERATDSLARRLDMSEAQIHRALEQGTTGDFERTELYRRVFALADGIEHRALARAAVPTIKLKSPKITRNLTTQWFATRVDQRYQACMKRQG